MSGWSEFKRPSKATLSGFSDVIAMAKLPSDPEAVRELLTGFCDWARGATARIPYLVTPPSKRQRTRQHRKPK